MKERERTRVCKGILETTDKQNDRSGLQEKKSQRNRTKLRMTVSLGYVVPRPDQEINLV